MNDSAASAPAVRDYRDTVFLPATAFPMRGDLPKREPRDACALGAHRALAAAARSSADRPKFVLHDGPPYANGHLHIGTALNKILKDVVNRARQMAGQDADLRARLGLPRPADRVADRAGIPQEGQATRTRSRCVEFRARVPRLSRSTGSTCSAQEFKRLGVLGDWAGRYATMDFPSEAGIVREIGKFLLNGALYRGKSPVMWSAVEKTALAEAEIEYHDHTSTTIWVRFPLVKAAGRGVSPGLAW